MVGSRFTLPIHDKMDPKKILKSTPSTSPITCTAMVLLAIASITLYNYSFNNLIASVLIFFFLFWIGHGLGQHRYLSHNAFEVNKFWHIVLVFSATLVSFVSPLGWAMLHKAHHRYNGTEKDSYLTKNPLKIFLCITNPNHVYQSDGKKLTDYWVQFTHRYYNGILLINNIILFNVSTFIWASFNVAVVMCYLAFIWTWAIAHKKFFFSYKNYENDDSYNDLFCGYILGEWHNNHHGNPKSLNEKVRWWEIDILYFISKGIKKNV